MAKDHKQDFRKTLNFILQAYYLYKEPVFMHTKLAEEKIPMHHSDVTAAINTLIRDGYIQHIAPEYSSIPLAVITGEGMLFSENGGYKDTTTRLDKMILWAKNHVVISRIMIVFIVLSSLTGMATFILQLVKFLTGSD